MLHACINFRKILLKCHCHASWSSLSFPINTFHFSTKNTHHKTDHLSLSTNFSQYGEGLVWDIYIYIYILHYIILYLHTSPWLITSNGHIEKWSQWEEDQRDGGVDGEEYLFELQRQRRFRRWSCQRVLRQRCFSSAR